MGKIREVVPVGFAHQKEKQDINLMPAMPFGMPIIEFQHNNALSQIGTLGGGNHFIEIQKGDDGHIWIMVHSGSRNLGYTVANSYNEKAVKLNDQWRSSVPKEWELAFLPLDSDEGDMYMKEMQYCVDFALANRKLMMDRIQLVMADVMQLSNGDFEPIINIAHNYAVMENHFGKNVLIHRKGATKAIEGLTGIIPGSMGTNSYIVEGLGNEESFKSCSHGAGRRMGRKEAIRTLNLEEEQKKMEGVLGAPRSQEELEEAPGAYKPINVVMKNQEDLVKIKVKLTPLGVIKG
jgi:tRNA-splicing ligase RtcB